MHPSRFTTRAIGQATRAVWYKEDGAALVEFSIFAPLLVVMAIYLMDFGLYFYRKMEVQNAAQAGADWAIANRVYNSPAIISAITNATNYTSIAVPSGYPILQCGCPSNSGVTFTTFNGGTCPKCSGAVGGLYVTAKAQAAYSSFIPYGLIPSSYTLAATSTARIQ